MASPLVVLSKLVHGHDGGESSMDMMGESLIESDHKWDTLPDTTNTGYREWVNISGA